MTVCPRELSSEDAKSVFRSGVTPEAPTDTIAVASFFNIITRY